MKNKKKTTPDEVKKLTKSIERVESDSILTDIYGNKIDVIEATEQADRDIEEIKKQWGGKRPNSGRKKQNTEKVKRTFELEKADIICLEKYAKKHRISKNKALKEAIHILERQEA
jgi:hypothetical protein